jgi:hypothetical protein
VAFFDHLPHPTGLLKKLKSINRRGAQALRNSPVGYFTAVASLQRWLFAKIAKN